jgi:hypothetical protein
LGGAYERGKPVRSLYNFRIPIHFCDEIGFFLAEDFYWFNPFLTEPGDLVLDIFAGSNTTGFVAEQENRYWLAFEQELEYLATSSFRFIVGEASQDNMECLYAKIMRDESVEISSPSQQLKLFEKTKTHSVYR